MFVCLFLTMFSLKTPPETLEQLGDSLRLLDELQGQIEKTESEFEPLKYVNTQ